METILHILRSLPWRIRWLACALGFALAATLVRLLQLSTAFEAPLGLAIPHAPASVTLLCLLVMAGAALLMLAVHQPLRRRPWAKGQAHRWDFAFLDVNDRVYPVMMVGAAFLALGAAPGLLIRGASRLRLYLELRGQHGQPTDNGFLLLCTAAGALLAFFGLLQMGRESFRPGRRGKGGFSAALPGAACCMWLLEHFRAHASDPVLWDFAPQIVAIVAGMLFYMDCAGMSTGASRPRRLLWLAGMTVVLSALSLPEQSSVSDLLLLAAQALAAAATLWRLPPNLENPPAAGQPYQPMQVPPQEEESIHE